MKPKTSVIWSYFVEIDDEKARCNLCDKVYSRKGRTTTSLKSHLKAIHAEQFAEFEKLNEATKLSSETKREKIPVSEPEIENDTNVIDQKPIILKVFTSESSVDNDHSISRTTDSLLHIDNNETGSDILYRNSRKRSLKDFHSRAKKLKSLTETVKASSHESCEHEFDIFGRSVGAQLKAMPIVKALKAQQHIQHYITRVRLQHVLAATRSTNPLSNDDPFDSTSPSASP